jgi:large subunit ribosomal protein L10
MAKTKEQKKEVITNLENVMKDAVSSVFVHFRGINVAQETAMRKGFRAEDIGYTVAKKSLLRRALDTLGHAHADLSLEGELAIAYNTTENADSTLVARKVDSFGKEFGVDKIVIMGGIFDGRIMNAEAMREIAMIPPIQVLRGMFVNVINSPIQRIAIALSQIAEKKSA